jgi:hypothetical protein
VSRARDAGRRDALEEARPMSRILIACIVVTAVVFAALPVLAADMEGKIQSIDTTERTLTLDNGTKVWLADAVAIDSIQAGADVTVSYEERDGKPVATSVTTK